MKKFFKKMAMLVGMFTIFLMTTSTYATLRCPEDGDAYIEITHGDKAISNGSLTGAYAYTKVGPVYFQDVDATKMIYQTISTPNGINLTNFSMWGHNNPINSSVNGIGNGSLKANSIKWFRNDNTYGGIFMKYNSRIIIRRLYEVKAGGKFSIVVTKGNGMETSDVKACVSQYDVNGKFLDDGAWHDSSEVTSIRGNTRWIIPIMRYNNGSNDAASGTDKTIGWGDQYDTDLSLYYVYYVFNPFTYTKDYGYDNKKETVNRWGVADVSSSFANPTRTGYTFKGWKITDSNGNVVQIINSAGKVVNQNSTCITKKELDDNDVLNGDIYYEKFFQHLTFTAQWTPNNYTNTLNYNANGGSGAPASQSVNRTYPNTSYTHTVSTTKPTRTGYTFAGWYTAASGGTKVGTTYTVGSNSNAGNQSSTLYAHWTANTYTNTLNYNANGGSGAPASQSVNRTYPNTSYTHTVSTTKPTRAGYTFNGWYTAASGGTKVGTTYTVGSNNATSNQSATIYAHWTVNTYTVTYNANGGTGSMTNSTATYDSNFLTRQNTFTRKGYTFAGWNEKADGTGTAWKLTSPGVYECGTPWKWTYTNNITLYAQWTVNTYTVTYNANGGTGSMSDSSIVYGNDFMTKQNVFTKPGYTFAGWNEKADGTGVAWRLTSPGVYESGKTWPYTYNYNITLYAQWTVNTYTVTYNANGGTGTMSDSTIVYGNDFITRQNAFTKPGYTFAGWNEKADGTGTAWRLTSPGVYESGKIWPYTYNYNITLYAQWVDDTAPDITHTYKKGNCNTEQSFNITVKDNGSGIKAYTISGAGVTATNGSLTYSYTSGTVLNNVTVGVTVKDAGELKITATDISGNTASTSIVFVKTYLDNNQSHIAGPNRLATGNVFSSVAGGTCHPYTINTYGETVTPEKPERKGCDNGGWSVNDFAMSGSNTITTNGNTYYVVWKDTLAPKVTVKAEEVDNTEWKLTLDIYDTTSTGASTYAGSDVVGYYIGGNRDYMKNTYYAVES